MPITRSYLNELDRSSAYYVLCHAAWRRSRGKKISSATYGGIRNPVIALDLAVSVVSKIARVEEMNEEGKALLESGMTYANADTNEIALMVHYLTESSEDVEAVYKSLLGMLEVPTKCLVVWCSPPEDYLADFNQEVVKTKEQSRLARKIAAAINSGASAAMIAEIFRSRGGLVIGNGSFVSVDIVDRHGATLTF